MWLQFRRIILIWILALVVEPVIGQSSVPMEIIPSGHLVIEAKVNGVKGRFIFDTGGGITIFTKKFSKKINGLRQQDGYFTGHRATGERIDAALYTAGKIEIGKWQIDNATVSIIEADLLDFDGLISLNILARQPITIDYKTRQLVFETKNSLEKKAATSKLVPLQLHKDRDKSIDIFSYVVLNDKDTLLFGFDSGAGANVFNINGRYLKDKTDTTKVQRVMKQSEIDPGVQTVSFITKTKKLALLSQPSIKVEDFRTRYADSLIYDGIVGINWLGSSITIDLEKERMLLQ